jgi:hypothetical protein
MVMKHLIAMAGAAAVLLCAPCVVITQARDFVERGQKMDAAAIQDAAIQDYVSTRRLQIPTGPLIAQQAPPPASPGATAGDSSAKNTNAGSHRGQRLHSRRRPHMHAMPRGMSDRQRQLRQQQEKSR